MHTAVIIQLLHLGRVQPCLQCDGGVAINIGEQITLSSSNILLASHFVKSFLCCDPGVVPLDMLMLQPLA